MSIKAESVEYISTYTRFDNIENAVIRKPAIVDTIKNAISRENQSNKEFKMDVHDSVINSTEDGKYILEIIIKKEFN